MLLSNRGLALPSLHCWLPYALAAAGALLLGWRLRHRLGRAAPWAALAATALAWAWLPGVTVDLPVRRGLGLQGGWQPS
ncbi:hypothetical protein MMA27_24640, partial [Salmonella enterica]|nr:hypothetical protein [Salmonella enterica]